jgi:hypothetical protein
VRYGSTARCVVLAVASRRPPPVNLAYIQDFEGTSIGGAIYLVATPIGDDGTNTYYVLRGPEHVNVPTGADLHFFLGAVNGTSAPPQFYVYGREIPN